MKPEAQRIAIAQHCGFEPIYDWMRDQSFGFAAIRHGGIWCARGTTHQSVFEDLPDYINDLNVMQGAWSSLGWEEKNDCVEHLKRIVKDAFCEAYFATAAQRAEAFLKTIGKWEPTHSPKIDAEGLR